MLVPAAALDIRLVASARQWLVLMARVYTLGESKNSPARESAASQLATYLMEPPVRVVGAGRYVAARVAMVGAGDGGCGSWLCTDQIGSFLLL